MYLIKGEETEAYSGFGDCVHRELLGVSNHLHFKNHHTILESEARESIVHPPKNV